MYSQSHTKTLHMLHINCWSKCVLDIQMITFVRLYWQGMIYSHSESTITAHTMCLYMHYTFGMHSTFLSTHLSPISVLLLSLTKTKWQITVKAQISVKAQPVNSHKRALSIILQQLMLYVHLYTFIIISVHHS